MEKKLLKPCSLQWPYQEETEILRGPLRNIKTFSNKTSHTHTKKAKNCTTHVTYRFYALCFRVSMRMIVFTEMEINTKLPMKLMPSR